MFYFVYILKILAMILITNTHYTDIYPYPLLASGGLLGNVMFLWVSGFLLTNLKGLKFHKWYFSRLKRVYPIIWIPTFILISIGFYTLESMNLIQYFLFPTYYHFIGSIILLYVPYYFVMKLTKLRNNIPLVSLIVFVLQLTIYLFFYDRSYYHIDTVREPMIRFLFFQAMLMGAYFRVYKDKYINNIKIANFIFLFIYTFLYLGSKLLFSRYEVVSDYQIVNQFVLILCLYYIAKVFISLEDRISVYLSSYSKTIIFLASITLEVYVVQFYVIEKLNISVFPINFIIVTSSIILGAILLHYIIKYLYAGIGFIYIKVSRR